MKLCLKRIICKAVSLCLAVCIMLLAVAQLGVLSGVSLSSADYTSELWLKAGYEYMMVNGGERKKISSTPGVAPYFVYEGDEVVEVYVPLAALTAYFGGSYTVNGDKISITNFNAKVFELTSGSTEYTKQGEAQTPLTYPPLVRGGEAYLTVEGTHYCLRGAVKKYINPDTGLIVLGYNTPAYDDSYTSLIAQIANIDGLLYENPTAEEIYQDIENNIGVASHPRLLVNQDRFDVIRAAYEKTGDLTEDEIKFKNYINNVIKTANSHFSRAFAETETGADWKDEASKTFYRQPYYLYDENGKRLYGVSEYEMPDGTVVKLTEYWQEVYPWQQSSPHGDGYDLGGRSNLDLVSQHLKFFAFAWQVTRQQKWADAFYIAAMEISKWEHWGEGHFLDCADGATEYALGFDWIYPAFSGTAEGKAKLRQMAETLFVLGVEVGYNAAKRGSNSSSNVSYTSVLTSLTNENLKSRKYEATLHARTSSTGNWHFQWTNNWQSVCISGMMLSSLAVMEYEDMKPICTAFADTLLSKIEKSVHHYAPDGSYLESPGYWEYSTRTFMLTIGALESSAGTSYGLPDTVGLHESYYFAANITDNNFYSWNYHDSSRRRVNSSTFYMAAKLWGDPNIAAARDTMLGGGYGIGAEMYDVLFYDPTLSEGGSGLALDYYGKNIDTVTMRSAWDKNGIFAGLHAGANNVVHGDIDSGNFYLATGNTIWFGDRGSEDYNINEFEHGDYFNNTYRYFYYNKSIVSHNSIFVVGNSKLPRGQIFNSQSNGDIYSKITTFKSESEGAYAIADLTPSFNTLNDKTNALCASAKRGMLFTNSRSTVVVQDEMSFKTPVDLVWSAESEMLDAGSLAEDGRTAYLKAMHNGKMTTMRATLLTDDESLKFRVVTDKDELFLTYLDTTINGGVIVTKKNSGNQKASDPLPRLVIEANDVTSFNVAVVFEIISDEREIVGYEKTEMKNWKISSDAWVKEANRWIEEEKLPDYKYGNSDLIKAMSKYDAASTSAEKFLVARELYEIINSIDPTLSGVKERIDICNGYISKFNVTRGKINKSFEEEFFTILKDTLGIE